MKNKYRNFLIAIGAVMALFSCAKSDYLTDDGIHQPKVNMNTYDYLASHPQGLFDTLITIVDHFNLKEEINSAKTFFAPTNYSIRRYYAMKRAEKLSVDENATYSLSEMLASMNVDSVRAYIYNDNHYSLNTAQTAYSPIVNAAGFEDFYYHKQLQTQGQWSSQPLYHLFFVRVRGEVDLVNDNGVVTTPEDDLTDLRVRCQTQGIETNTGTIINVLANTHFFINDFLSPIEPEWGQEFVYNVSFPRDVSNYSGKLVEVDKGAIANAFGLTESAFDSKMSTTIIFNGASANGSLNPNSTATPPGHWFDAEGNVTNYGATSILYSEFRSDTFSFMIGQYPGQAAAGTTYVIRQAFVYKEGSINLQATLKFVVTIE